MGLKKAHALYGLRYALVFLHLQKAFGFLELFYLIFYQKDDLIGHFQNSNRKVFLLHSNSEKA